MTHRQYLYFLHLLLLGLFLGGCAHYEAPRDRVSQPIQLAPIVNNSTLPQISAPLAKQLRRAIATDRHWHLSSHPQAPMLQILIAEVDYRSMARNPDDTGQPLSVAQTVRVRFEWLNEHVPIGWDAQIHTDIAVDSLLYTAEGLVGARSQDTQRVAHETARSIMARLNQIAD